MHTIFYYMGLTDPSGWPYLWWSGIAQFIIGFAIYSKHHNCHTKGCWRMGHPNVAGHVQCRKHREQNRR